MISNIELFKQSLINQVGRWNTDIFRRAGMYLNNFYLHILFHKKKKNNLEDVVHENEGLKQDKGRQWGLGTRSSSTQ